MIVDENAQTQRWTKILKEDLGVQNAQTLNWMAKYAQGHEMFESIQNGSSGGIYTTPLNTIGMGNPMAPQGTGFNTGDGTGIGNTGADFHSYGYKAGSGDIPTSTLTISLEVAAATIGLELVGVVPSPGPWLMLQYMDFPYAGGKLGNINETSFDGVGDGAENKPIYIKITGKSSEIKQIHTNLEAEGGVGTHVTFTSDNGEIHGVYLGKSRIDGGCMIQIIKVVKGTDNVSIADVMDADSVTVGDVTLSSPRAELIASAADHITSFSNFFGDGQGNAVDDPMTRAQNETGVGNTIGLRFFTKMIQMGSYEVTGAITRQQLQDLPLYGINAAQEVINAMQNQLTQSINNRILDRVFKLGVTNAINLHNYDNVDLNLYFGNAGADASKDLSSFHAAKKFIGIDNQNGAAGWGAVNNAIQNTAAENVYTHQRRIMSRILSASNLIATTSRWGRADWVVTNTQVLSALQDCSAFMAAPMTNTLTQDKTASIYCAGSIAGLNVYVDPYMPWNDTRVLVGRKSDGKTPGVIFMPYILMDTITTTAEGTMAPRILTNSRFAIADVGFHPELNYLCFMIDANDGFIV